MKFRILTPQKSHQSFLREGKNIIEIHTATPVSDLAVHPHDDQLNQRSGHWSRIEETPGKQIDLYTDRCLSFPLYYTKHGETWIVGTDINQLAKHINANTRNANAAAALLNCGHTLGEETLYSGIFSVPAGYQVTLNENGVEKHSWVHLHSAAPEITTDTDFDQAFDQALTNAFSRAISEIGNQQIAIPLSGGLDSRLLLTYLQKVGAKNLIAFTYGKPGSAEMAISQAIAEQAQIPWHGVLLDSEKIAATWRENEGDQFIIDTWSGFALPHIQDWWALRELTKTGILHPGDVVFPGHTVVGNMHNPESTLPPYREGQIFQTMIKKYWCLQGKTPSKEQIRQIIAPAVKVVKKEIHWQDLSALSQTAATIQILNLYEKFDIAHRQAKYINNSMRGYEHFGLQWALPMLDREPWETWFQASAPLTMTRDWYARFTNQQWAEAFPSKIKYYAAKSTNLPGRIKQPLLTALRATGADSLLSFSRSVRTNLDHPMAFEAFATGYSGTRLAGQLLTGRHLLGIYTEQLLNNQWGSGKPLLP